MSVCRPSWYALPGLCTGVGCCQSAIPPGISFFEPHQRKFPPHQDDNPTFISNAMSCHYVFLVDTEWFTYSDLVFLNHTDDFDMPVVLDWAVRNVGNCSAARRNATDFACRSARSECFDADNGPGYRCNCSRGYDGNPYLDGGCTDIDDCQLKDEYSCYGVCTNSQGSYTCQCPPGTSGDATRKDGCRQKDKFTLALKWAAIKKSKMMEATETKEFAREMLILSQINHRNIVKLHGCCLEVEVPMLVYEYVSNGTLYHYIHGGEGLDINKALDTRLRIAAESAEALSYMHSSASPPILHDDVKTANILLDGSLAAKVSDVGASKLQPSDEAEIATLVQGTCGYLDPEYLMACQLTDKSDIYSFGVVLLELLTGKKVLCFDGPEEDRSLVSRFTMAVKADQHDELLEDQVRTKMGPEALEEVTHLVMHCVSMIREERPSMKEVAEKLEALRSEIEAELVYRVPVVGRFIDLVHGPTSAPRRRCVSCGYAGIPFVLNCFEPYQRNFPPGQNGGSDLAFIINTTSCHYVFLVELDWFSYSDHVFLNRTDDFNVSVVLSWAMWSVGNCSTASRNATDFAYRSARSECFNVTNGPKYRCSCS
ncbi:wall-associated receptor kinase 5-like [Aegilops tauschii subsp. strangulata]|uniref:wall-associated receptor kinase 5-like n=1 Tax=Aegilops tauschii subsp. strangulata TaxID=200361 RepID=UPI003CC88E6E